LDEKYLIISAAAFLFPSSLTYLLIPKPLLPTMDPEIPVLEPGKTDIIFSGFW